MVVLSGDRIGAPLENVGSVSMGDAAAYENGRKIAEVKGSLYSYCAAGKDEALCRRFVASPERFSEKKGPLAISYESCRIVNNTNPSALIRGPCVSSVEVNGNKYYQDLQNDVVVYQPGSDEVYSRTGDIIHRALLKLQTPEGNVYVLTWGDNNPIMDVQVYDYASGMGNRPVETQRTKGRIVFTIPYLGYLKLAISPVAIMTPEGCDRHYAKWDDWKN
jgi:hypothetical protein